VIVHVLIPVRNNIDITTQCLRLLSRQTFKDFDVTVIDDASTDGTAEFIRKNFPDVTVLQGDGNLWWAGAINMGLEHVLSRATDDDFILTLNDDVTFESNYIEQLFKAARLRPGFLIGSVSLDKDDYELVVDAGAYFDWRMRKRVLGCYRPGDHFNDHVNQLSGRGALIPVTVFQSVGLYAERRLPHYAADYELAIRAHRAGFPACVFYGAVLHSDTSVSGYKFTPFMKLSFGQAWQALFSKKSVYRIETRLNFLWLCSPRRYLVRDLAVEVLTILQILTSVAPMWHIKILFRPFVKYIQRGLQDD